MLSSMTGYGRSQQLIDGREIGVEIKSVNHRYFEFSSRLPRNYGYLEEKLKAFVYNKISRGKVDVSVSILTVDGATSEVQINLPLAKSYADALRTTAKELGLKDDLTISKLSRFSDIFIIHRSEADEEEIWKAVGQVASDALDKFLEMRSAEGKALQLDIESRLELITKHVRKIKGISPGTTEQYRAKLYSRICDILADTNIDEQRILTEAAIFAEKTAVSEETVRLISHMTQMASFLKQNEAVGRKLDFLVQECNREANTIGSKAQDMEIQRLVVEIKSEIEKIREQIQNIE